MIHAMLVSPFKEEHIASFSDIEGYRFSYCARPTPEDLAEVDVILGHPSLDVMRAAPRLKWVQHLAAGVDGITSRAAEFPRGVALTCLSGAYGQSISECVLAMVLSIYKKLPLYRDNQDAALWRDEGRQESPVGKRLLILGAGNIGCAVARLFRPFGCHITGVRRVLRALPPEFDEMITLDDLDAALPKADIVVSALPNTPATAGLFGRERLALLNKNAVLINVGRGNLIDCAALAERLNAGLLLGAGLDVTDPEPLPGDHPLWTCKNALITPHITGGCFGHLQATEEFMFNLCRDNLARFRDGEPLLNLVDFETGYRSTDGRA
ncbi:MAG: D-2-hydroxyacid dehydrogenase [Clostridia bacterium]|nr:D-2-hydroxyacid dehydrogenase [Clostridia bacterium]